MPKVSIVLPNYNYARYLDERIQSLLNQTYKDFELIILDDASTDNSLEVIEKYTADPRVKTKFYTENSGLPYKRWNDGADLAQGEYLLIAGADDTCHPTLLEKLVEKLDNHASVGLAFAQSWEINSEGKKLGLLKEYIAYVSKERWERDFVDTGKNECQYLLFTNTIPNASAVLMRRKVFAEAGKFDVQLRLAADWMLWVKMLMISDIAFVAEPLNYFRTHNNTVRSKTEKDGISIEEIFQVQKYILNNPNITLSKEAIKKVCNSMKDVWFNAILDSSIKISLGRNIRIYKILASLDPTVGVKLILKFLFSLMKVNQIKQKLRKVYQ
ncbi:glycosyltransferase [Scytonema tolypothrichoides VB-61278]|nr:glycosyltransferase [Scytonema tolypothrichoides VB-61278]